MCVFRVVSLSNELRGNSKTPGVSAVAPFNTSHPQLTRADFTQMQECVVVLKALTTLNYVH